MSTARSTSLASLTAALLSVTCWIGPSSGEILIDLATTNGDTQAVQFIVTAAQSKMVEHITPACSACQVFTVRLNDGDLRGVVTGPIASGPLLRLLVSDVDAVEAYSAQVVDAANGASVLLEASAYSVSLRKP